MLESKELLLSYNPWWVEPEAPLPKAEPFHRPLFHTLMADLESIPQMLSVTGPRRIGKSTLLYQLIEALLKKGVPPERLVYYSFDDPALMLRKQGGERLIESLMKSFSRARREEPAYLFLDEIQRLERWELYLKKYYDLKYPVRVVISGSASSPIFKKSRESLLGRVKDYHLLPFSFREAVLFDLQGRTALLEEVEGIYRDGRSAEALLTGDHRMDAAHVDVPLPSPALREHLDRILRKHFLEGGFPEVWGLPTWVAKQDYLFDNQVKKVIYEDLVLAAEFRKPDMLKRFYVSLLEKPGQETSVQAMAAETGVSAQQIEKYLPLLEMTDLLHHVEKFRKSPLRVRKGKMKFYLVDLALRNAVLRLSETLLDDADVLGLYAEDLVYLALKKWRGTLQVDYYRDRDEEVDFIVHTGPRTYVPVEVKYRSRIQEADEAGLKRFAARYKVRVTTLLVTKTWDQLGRSGNVMRIPLPLFLLMFD